MSRHPHSELNLDIRHCNGMIISQKTDFIKKVYQSESSPPAWKTGKVEPP